MADGRHRGSAVRMSSARGRPGQGPGFIRRAPDKPEQMGTTRTAEPASADTGPRDLQAAPGGRVRGLAAALAATLLGSFALGSHQEPAVSVAGIYRVDPPAPCLGGQVEVRQSGRFVDIAGGHGAEGSLEHDGHRLTGQVRCADSSTTPLQATVTGEAGQRSLSGKIGGNRFRASFLRDHPEPAEAVAASGEPLTPEALFGRLTLAIAAVIVAARAVGALAARIGQPRVMGEVLAGILLGPTLLGALLPGVQAYLFPPQVIPLLAASVSTASVAVPLLLGVALALPLFTLLAPATSYAPFALFIGAALSITAFP